MKRRLFILFFGLAFCCAASWSESFNDHHSAVEANRRTSLRFLNIAQSDAVDKNWDAVISQSELGLSYDKGISDLWYLLAVAKKESGYRKGDVLSDVEKAIKTDEWVNYNRDNARVFYADLLCDTTRYDEVFAVLDSSPFIYSADAEYIRIKALYRKGDKDSVLLARTKIDGARRIYPDDERFPLVFYKNEDPESDEAMVRDLCNVFTKKILQDVKVSPDNNTELEIYCAVFARDKDKELLLKSFAARNLNHPLYAMEACRAGLIDQRESFSYIKPFLDEAIDYDVLISYLNIIDDENTVAQIRNYFASYAGTIFRDTDGDGIENLKVKYNMGRPEEAEYDSNQDDDIDWSIDCDYGAPVNCHDYINDVEYHWGTYPYLESVAVRLNDSQVDYTFRMVPDTLPFNIVGISSVNKVTELTGIDFYFLENQKEGNEVSVDSLLNAARFVEVPSSERKDSVIDFNVLHGLLYSADYYYGGKLYATCHFEDGMPSYRSIDNDKDGSFETTEIYAPDSDGSVEVHSLEDEKLIVSNIFGTASNFSDCYLKMVQIDRNGDSVPDYTEEYLNHGGKICSWDTDNDGQWNNRYVKFPENKDGIIEERYMFHNSIDGSMITLCYKDGSPSSFITDNIVSSVIKDRNFELYWVDKVGTEKMADKVLNSFNHNDTENVCIIVEDEDCRVMGINMSGVIFADIISYSVK